MDDCLVIGGGVVGLSIAYELSGRGMRVTVLDKGEPGKEASWAGAGILPAAIYRENDSAYDRLSGLSLDLHRQWAQELLNETGIDNEFRQCGELYVARSPETLHSTSAEIDAVRRRGIEVEDVVARIHEVDRSISPGSDKAFTGAFHLPQSAQLRNPRHLKALVAACRQRRVNIVGNVGSTTFQRTGNRVTAVQSGGGSFRAETYCVSAGAWSDELFRQLEVRQLIKPMRGQIVLLRLPEQVLSTVIHEGPFYLVPRLDGRILVGSTVEDVGFDKRTTSVAVQELLQFALSLVPDLSRAEFERSWAGLRPGSPEGKPFISRVADLENVFAATGHFRWGLYLSPGTARIMGQLVCGEKPQIDISDFRLNR